MAATPVMKRTVQGNLHNLLILDAIRHEKTANHGSPQYISRSFCHGVLNHQIVQEISNCACSHFDAAVGRHGRENLVVKVVLVSVLTQSICFRPGLR